MDLQVCTKPITRQAHEVFKGKLFESFRGKPQGIQPLAIALRLKNNHSFLSLWTLSPNGDKLRGLRDLP